MLSYARKSSRDKPFALVIPYLLRRRCQRAVGHWRNLDVSWLRSETRCFKEVNKACVKMAALRLFFGFGGKASGFPLLWLAGCSRLRRTRLAGLKGFVAADIVSEEYLGLGHE